MTAAQARSTGDVEPGRGTEDVEPSGWRTRRRTSTQKSRTGRASRRAGSPERSRERADQAEANNQEHESEGSSDKQPEIQPGETAGKREPQGSTRSGGDRQAEHSRRARTRSIDSRAAEKGERREAVGRRGPKAKTVAMRCNHARGQRVEQEVRPDTSRSRDHEGSTNTGPSTRRRREPSGCRAVGIGVKTQHEPGRRTAETACPTTGQTARSRGWLSQDA